MAAENTAKYDKRLNYEEAFVVYVIIYGYTWDFEINKYPKYFWRRKEEKLKN